MDNRMLLGMISGAFLLKGFYYFVNLYKNIKKNENERQDTFSETIKKLHNRMENINRNVQKFLDKQTDDINQKLADVLSAYSSLSFTEKGLYKTSASMYNNVEILTKKINDMNEYELKKFEDLLNKVYERPDIKNLENKEQS